MTPAEMIDKYIQLRNAVAAVKAKHVEELTPYNEVMLKLEAELMKHLHATKLDSVNGPAGTAYRQHNTSVTVDNWQQTLDFIVAGEHWDLLEARVAKAAALQIMEDTKKPIPGVKISQLEVLRVRAG